MSENSHRIQIWIAIIGLIGVLGTAIFSNWDKIFSHGGENSVGRVMPSKPPVSGNENTSLSQIDIYYFPSRKNDALTLKSLLERQTF